MASGAPDYERIVTVEAEVEMGTGAPDWERIVVGAGGVPVGGGSTGVDGIQAQDYGYAGWTGPLYNSGGASSLATSGALYAIAKATKAATVQHVVLFCVSGYAGSDYNGQYVALYTAPSWPNISGQTLQLLGASAANVFPTTAPANSFVSVPLSSPVALTAGQLFYIATFGPPTSNVSNWGYYQPNLAPPLGTPFTLISAGLTGAPPASVTSASWTIANNFSVWAAVE